MSAFDEWALSACGNDFDLHRDWFMGRLAELQYADGTISYYGRVVRVLCPGTGTGNTPSNRS